MKLEKLKSTESSHVDKPSTSTSESTSTSTSISTSSETLTEAEKSSFTSLPFFSRELYWSLVASLSFLCTGLLRAYTSPALLSIQNEKRGNESTSLLYSSPSSLLSPASSITDLISWFASIAPLASFLGTILSGPSLDQLGRRQSLFLLSLPSFLGWILVSTASSISTLLIGRALTGFAAGLATASAPLYISELCQSQSDSNPDSPKRKLGLLPGILHATGVLLGFLLADRFQEWRTLAEIISLFPLLLCILSLTIPESPIWLQGRRKRLKKIDDDLELGFESKFDLQMEQVVPAPALSPPNPSKTDPIPKTNLSEKTGLLGKSNKGNLLIYLRLIFPISVLMTLQQFSGGNVLIFYLSEILTKNSKLQGRENAYIIHEASLIIGFVQFIGFLLAIPLIDRNGRWGQRSLLIVSAVLMSLAHLVLGIHFYNPAIFQNQDENYEDGSNHNHYNTANDTAWSTSMIIRVTSLSFLFSSYSIGLGPIPFLFIQMFSSDKEKLRMEEMEKAIGGKGNGSESKCEESKGKRKQNQVKSYISSVASLVNHLALFAVVKGFPYLFHMEGHGTSTTFFAFAGVCWTAALFAFFFVPNKASPSL